MAAAGLLFALCAATGVGLHLEDVEELSPETSARLLAELARAIGRDPRLRVVVDEPAWPICGADAGCRQGALRRMDVEELVLVGLLGGPTLIRLSAERAGPRASATLSLDIPRDPARWGPAVEQVRERLFGAVGSAAPDLTPPPPPPPAAGPGVLPWVLVGASAVALIAGTGFHVSSRAANAELDAFLRMERVDELESRVKGHAVLSAVCFSAAGALAVAGGALFLTD